MNQQPSLNVGTREKRNVIPSDAGFQASENRFQSELHFIPPPCDIRETMAIFGSASRLIGRSEMLRKK